MEIRLKRYYGDAEVTKSVMEVWMQGEEEPRMVCEAREVGFRDYEVSFPGASQVCLPRGRWRMKVGGSPYGAMGLRVARCPGHRQVFVGHRWARQMFEGEVLVGEPVFHYYTDEEGREVEYPKKRRIADGEAVFGRLTELVYEAWGTGRGVLDGGGERGDVSHGKHGKHREDAPVGMKVSAYFCDFCVK